MSGGRRSGPGPARSGALLALFFASGAAALIYEVLWLKELGRLFGNTSQAAATALAVFFLGLSAGSFVWGRGAARSGRPLRTYSWLETGIALSALLYFALFDLVRWVLGPLQGSIGHRPAAVLLVKFCLSLGILFPPAFFMGGTLPVMAQFLVRRADQLGRKASLLYALNTIGAAVGALLAGFVLPRHLGYRGSYLTAIALNATIAIVTRVWSAREPAAPAAAPGPQRPPQRPPQHAPALVWAAALVSGFATLGLEVLWTRMFAQVLQNSVYTFAAILTVFLAALALGSAAAGALCRTAWAPRAVLFWLLTLSGLLVGLTPLAFWRYTAGLQALGGGGSWPAYVTATFAAVAIVLLVPATVMGSVFPYLMKLGEARMQSAGQTVGQLAAANTVAAILGSLLAGFVLLEALGLWSAIRLMALCYLALAVAAAPARARWLRAVPAAGLVLFAAFVTYRGFGATRLERGDSEELIEVREGSAGTVAVFRRGSDVRLKINTTYTLGGSDAAVNLRLQAWLPLALQRDARSVFFLGMGTGMTAGGALDFPVERVVVSELNRDIIRASREHFAPWVNGLHDDPRVEVVNEDGRTLLAVSPETYDLIVADIFLTYKAGVGSLYTREHFETARSRLAPGGAFVQWLTMFDLSPEEFGIIARTMNDVFADLTLWRRSVSPRFPVYALIGRNEATPLEPEVLARNLSYLRDRGVLDERVWLVNIPLAAYAGNVKAAHELFDAFPVSTDDRTPLEYLAPISERRRYRGDSADAELAWEPLADFCERLLRAVPPRDDPSLSLVGDGDIGQVEAGLAYYRYLTLERLNRKAEATAYLDAYRRLIGDLATPPDP